MRIFRIIVLIVAIGITLVRGILFITKSDIDVPPVIKCDKDIITVKCSDSDDEVLRGVTAYDEQDGDLTDKLFVERMYYMSGEKKSKISFVVIDSDNNVTKLKKDVIYADYESPKIEISSDLILEKDKGSKIGNYFSAKDIFDGNITNRLRIISDSYNSSVPGTYKMLARVSNTRGDVTEVNFNAYVIEKPYEQTIELKKNIIYSKVGKAIDFKSFVKGGTADKSKIVINAEKVDINKEGSYEVLYSVKENDKLTAFNRLIVMVGDWE